MKNMNEKIISKIGDASIKLADSVVNECWIFGFYEPKIPVELLKDTADNK